MNKLTEILKQHVYCIIIIATTLLISGTIVAYKTQDDALSMTSSVVSIVLAVVVIFYTFYHSERSSRMTEQSERNMRETKEAVSEILHKTANTEAILNQMQSQSATDREDTFKDGDDLDFGQLRTSIAVEAREKVVEGLLKPKSPDEKIRYLIRAYVNLEFDNAFIRTYDLIYGSQTLLLESLEQNREGFIDDYIRSNYYLPAFAKDPVYYDTYSYENYMGFLKNSALILKEGEKWKITDFGLDFMNYLRTSNILKFAQEKWR